MLSPLYKGIKPCAMGYNGSDFKMKLKKVICGFLATVFAMTLNSTSAQIAFASTKTVSQTVFELNVEDISTGDVPNGVTVNEGILDKTKSASANALISTAVSADTEFLKIDFNEASKSLGGDATGLYTIELVTNVNDSDSATSNGTLMYLKGVTDYLVFRARENSDICAMPNKWANLYWQANTGATATYIIEDLKVSDGSAKAHYAKRDTANQYNAYANGHAIEAGNATGENPINTLTIKAAKSRCANIKSLKVTRKAVVETVTYQIGAESCDDSMGSVTISSASVESGESVTLKAIPKQNYIFDGWYDKESDIKIEGAGQEWTFNPTQTKTYVAKFAYAQTFNITAKSANNSKGTVLISDKGPYFENDEVTFNASAKSGYIFDGWYKNSEKVSDVAAYTVSASKETEGEYIAKFISASLEEQEVYTLDINGILNSSSTLPQGITLNGEMLDTLSSENDNALKSKASLNAESFMTIDLETLVSGMGLEGLSSGIYKLDLQLNVKDDEDALNGTDLFAVNNSGAKQLLTASESAGVKATTGSGMNGGGDSYNRRYITYSFDINVKNGSVTSMLTDNNGVKIFNSVANGQTVTLPGVSETDSITKIIIKNIAGQRANIKGMSISRNVANLDYGNAVPIFNETCVKLIDTNGESVHESKVSSTVKTIEIDFKSVLDETTVNSNSIYVSKDGTKLDIAPIHCDGIVVFDMNGLVPNSSYSVTVTADVKNVDGVTVRNAGTYNFTTKDYECTAKIISIQKGGSKVSDISQISQNDSVSVNVQYINTNSSARDLYIIYAAYKNNNLADIQIAEYANIGYTISGEYTPTFVAGDMNGVTAVKIFAFDRWDTKTPLDSVCLGTNINYGRDETATGVKVNNSEEKIAFSANAKSQDKLWVEVVKGDAEHTQVFDGLNRTGDIYKENIPLVFFDTVEGGFSLDITPDSSGDYVVYVKNITTGQMLIDGQAVVFLGTQAYKELVDGLNSPDSLTDNIAKKLGFDILLNENLTDTEKKKIKEMIFGQGLTYNDEANKKLCNECAAMAVINSRNTVTADFAKSIMDCLRATIDSDASLKSWFDKYITDTASEQAFVNKLLATTPKSSGADKIEKRSDITDALKVALVLEIAKAPNGYINIGLSFNEFKNAFGRTSVSSANAVYEKMIGTYANKAAFLKKYDDCVKATSKTPQGGGSGGGSSGGGSGGGSSGISINYNNSGGVPTVTASTQSTPMEKNIFTDIDSVPWAQEAIVALKVKNVISGKTETKFYPNDKITREEFTKLVVSAVANDSQVAQINFGDVKPGAWYYPFIQKAKFAGIVNGIDSNYFGISRNITRQDMAVIIFNAAKYKNVVGNTQPEEFPFGDDPTIADYAKESVYTLKAMGIINGIDADNFAPLSSATRAQAAVMIYRLLLR